MHLNDLQKRAHQTAVDKGWWDPPKTLGEQVLLMHTELSEAVEEIRSGDAADLYIDENGKPCGFAVELVDSMIRAMDTLESIGIDTEKIMEWKMDYNDSRPHRHGGKKM